MMVLESFFHADFDPKVVDPFLINAVHQFLSRPEMPTFWEIPGRNVTRNLRSVYVLARNVR